jgi:RAB protein geranylgeranyltransferase component A
MSKTLAEAEQAELDFVPLKTPSGQRTALAEELAVELTPTLVVTHEDILCSLDETGDEFCDFQQQSVERFVGANNIIQAPTSNARRIHICTSRIIISLMNLWKYMTI